MKAIVLAATAVLVSGLASAQAPVVDGNESTAAGGSAGELFFQLQTLRQEIMELRGLVEEQSFQIQELRKQGMERYIDLDRRIGGIQSGGGSSSGASSAAASTEKPAAERPQTEADVYSAAYGLVKQRQFAAALDRFNSYVEEYPNGRYTPNAWFWLGELYLANDPQDLKASRAAFSRLLSAYPQHAKVPDALYKLGKVYFLQGESEKSQHLLNQVIERYGSGTSSAPALAKEFLKENF